MKNLSKRQEPTLKGAALEEKVLPTAITPVVAPRPGRPGRPVVEAVNPSAEPVGLKRGLFISAALLLLGLVVSTLLVDKVLQPGKFKLSKINVEGELRNVDGEAVRVMADSALQSDSGSNFFSVDLKKMKRALEQVPWVAKVSVRRRWPDTLTVEIIEAIPVAQWNDDEWIAQTGRLIKFPGPQMPDKRLPLLLGAAGDHDKIWQQYKLWMPMLEQSGLAIKSLELNARHAWKLKVFAHQRVVFNAANNTADNATGEHKSATSTAGSGKTFTPDNEVVLLLGKDNIDDRFNRFINGYKNSLQNDFYRVSQIDLRYPNGLALRFSQAKTVAKEIDQNVNTSEQNKPRLRQDPVTDKHKQTSV